ncbi:helix-turn-helix transcriptional regulator, partial [Ralstonia pseudosolanacearum]|uniref:helix-turn-helix transcriptional regulator n=1 Tax=Ralstonia pseudosolanacearum TaxID=1310165 RepID=UPI003CFA429E
FDDRATFLTLDHAAHRLHLAVQPLTRVDGIADAGGALVMISDGNLAGEIPAAALAALFDLTEAESRLASALVQGDTLEQYAQRRGVSIGTVRYQLKQVLSKTGTNRQSELMRKVLCSAAAHAAGFQSASMH